MSILDLLLGRPLSSREEQGQRIAVLAGIAIFGLDALSSAAYGPEAALTVMRPLGALGNQYLVPISLSIIALLTIVFFSYRQTIAALNILGSDLTGATSVTFNGTAAVFTVVSSSEITTTVPAGATTGKVQVATPSGTLSSTVPFRVP